MKKIVTYLSLCCGLFLWACTPNCDTQAVVEQVKLIRLVEEKGPREIIVNAGVEAKANDEVSQQIPITSRPISLEDSQIVIEDTLDFRATPGDLEVESSPDGLQVYVKLNIAPAKYFCKNYSDGKMTCERGEVGRHFNKNGLTVLDSFPAVDHFASSTQAQTIHILKKNPPPGSIQNVKQYSTVNKTIYICHERGQLIVVEKP